MGRARKRDADFIVFLDTNEEIRLRQKYASFCEYNVHLANYLRDNAIHLDEDEVEIIPDDMELLYPPFCPGNTVNSPKISMTGAIAVVNQ